jgi:conjugal transfer/entry exclusion protein
MKIHKFKLRNHKYSTTVKFKWDGTSLEDKISQIENDIEELHLQNNIQFYKVVSIDTYNELIKNEERVDKLQKQSEYYRKMLYNLFAIPLILENEHTKYFKRELDKYDMKW